MKLRSHQGTRGILRLLLPAGLLLVLSGCSQDVVYIESNTSWEGTVNNYARIQGVGNKSYDVHGALSCVTVRKLLPDSLYLRMRINNRPNTETSAPLGGVTACK